MDLIKEMFGPEAEQTALPSDDGQRRVADLAARMVAHEAEIVRLSALIEKEQTSYNEIAFKLLPELMHEIGMLEFTLVDGNQIAVAPFYSASITEERAPDAHAWLRANGHGDIIKNEVKAAFGKGEDEKVEQLLTVLNEKQIPYERREGVHPSTLKAFVKEQYKKGSMTEKGIELLSVHVGEVAQIGAKRKSKKEKA
jgi:hypothetical protein